MFNFFQALFLRLLKKCSLQQRSLPFSYFISISSKYFVYPRIQFMMDSALFFFLERGRCVAPYKCDCAPGWTGASCALFDCAGVNQCSGQGVCVSSNTCRCYPGFQGANCSDVVDCEILGNCSGNGVCIQGGNDGNFSCRYKASLLS